jgi:GMP synthase (glutamine-hydrolysing)
MIAILDFGSQYAQLIARRVRALRVFAQIVPHTVAAGELRALAPEGIILSGGPASVIDPAAPRIDPAILELGCPVLGICYGMQLMVHLLGGEVRPQAHSEYGRARLVRISPHPLFAGVPEGSVVWMSHNDAAVSLPPDWETLAATEGCSQVAVSHRSRSLFGLQFHPEVHHSRHGRRILRNFVLGICRAKRTWRMSDYVAHVVEETRARLAQAPPDARIVGAVSGGVDSTVLAALMHRAVGDRFVPVFVDNGLLRKDEATAVRENFRRHLGIEVVFVDAAERFLTALRGVIDPEEKRRIIGRLFVEVFLGELRPHDLLAQGTLYPDVIESVSVRGPSATIKTHHNRVREILELMEQGRVVEPLRELFKDEVRELGRELGIPHEILWRQPFPGPGLAVRILGEVTPARLAVLREADAIVAEEIKAARLYHRIWQSFAVLLPVKAVGVMGDARTYADVVALRAVESVDGMTADFVKLPWPVLSRIASRIINEVAGVNRVVYDVSSKPPATIEWE